MKFIWLYIPVIWFSGVITIIQFTIFWVEYIETPLFFFLLLPFVIFADHYIFLGTSLLFIKLLLVLINLIHKPKEGIFHIIKDRKDYLFWGIRKLLKKYVIWFARNSPLPWTDTIAFRWFGVKVNFSNSILDAWLDFEFIDVGKKVFIGQGATVISSSIIGEFLVIKKVILEDQAIVGSQAVIAPGTIIKKNTVLGAFSTTAFNQILEPNWVYMGVPARKLKPNKFAEEREERSAKRDFIASERGENKIQINGGN